MVAASTAILPEDRPRYLMGVGSPTQLFESVERGMDIFDSVFPTRNARHKNVFTKTGRENIHRSNFGGKSGPIQEDCGCYTCRNFSRAYIHHMFKSHEMLGQRLVTLHNVHFIQDLMKGIRASITQDRFLEYKTAFMAEFL